MPTLEEVKRKGVPPVLALIGDPKGHAPKLTMEKSKEILRHGEVRGHALTRKQKGFFGARAGGAPMRKKR